MPPPPGSIFAAFTAAAAAAEVLRSVQPASSPTQVQVINMPGYVHVRGGNTSALNFSTSPRSSSPPSTADDAEARARLRAQVQARAEAAAEKAELAKEAKRKRGEGADLELEDPSKKKKSKKVVAAPKWQWSKDAKRIALMTVASNGNRRNDLFTTVKQLKFRFPIVFAVKDHVLVQSTIERWFDKYKDSGWDIDAACMDGRAANGSNLESGDRSGSDCCA
jgi:hypothetical protein